MIGLASCATEPRQESIPIGTYEATTYLAGPTVNDRIDLLAYGVDWQLVVGGDRSVASEWHVEREGLVSNTSHIGTFSRRDGEIRFVDFTTSDRILTERTWRLDGDQIVSLNQVVDGVIAEIRFTRR